MITPELIEAMKSAGMSADQIADAVKRSFSAPKPKAEKDNRATRIPEGWHIGGAELSAALKIGLTRDQIQFEGEQFRDHWSAKSGKDATKVDWLATWRTWCRNSVKYGKPRFTSQNHEKPKSRNQLHQEAVDRELAKIINGEGHDEFPDNVIDLAQRDYRFTA